MPHDDEVSLSLTLSLAEVFEEIFSVCSNIMGKLNFPAPTYGQDDVILPLKCTVVSDLWVG